MDERDLTTYARSIAAALHVMGPTPREQVIGMLCGLNLSANEASRVIAYGLAHGILEDSGGKIRGGSER